MKPQLTQTENILRHLRSGRWINPLMALNLYGTMKLSTRLTNIRRSGVELKQRWKELPSGKKVMEYRLSTPK